MGYNLMVFEPAAAPKEAAPFLAWYAQQTDWNDTDDYDDYDSTTPRLRAFFLDMVATHPPINGPLAADELDDSDIRLTDYSIGRDIIYLGGSWENADTALALALQLAESTGSAYSTPPPRWCGYRRREKWRPRSKRRPPRENARLLFSIGQSPPWRDGSSAAVEPG